MYYHVWFVTKYRKPVLEGDVEKVVKDSFSEVARNKNYNILELETNKDHAHILLEAKNREELVNTVRILKSVSAKKILLDTPHLRVGNIRYREAQGSFWARRYGWKEVSKNDIESIREYIREQKKIAHT